jgi:putative inorganic carbon (HCO3(-)) transporter
VSFSISEERARSLAGIGLIGLILTVTTYYQPQTVGPLSLDSVVAGVPLAILMCLPYVRHKGIGTAPRYLLGIPALLFLGWGLVSVVATGGQFATWLTMARYASYFLLAVTISVVAQDSALRRLILWVLVLSGAATAVLAYVQYWNPGMTPGMAGISPEITTRVVGTFYNSNFYAEYLLLILGVAIALVFTEKLVGRLISGALGFVMLGAFLLTYTRGSWLGLAAGLLVFIVVVDVRYLVVAAVLGAGGLLVPGVLARLKQSQSNAGSADFRLGIWQIAGEAIRRHPLFGYGPGNFLDAYRDVVMNRPDLFQGYLGFGAHDSYFEIAAETGALGGFLFFVVTALYATRGLFIATRKGVDRETKYLALGLSVGLIGFVANTFTSNTFQHPQSGLFFWILSGVVASLGAGVWESEVRTAERKRAPFRLAEGSAVAVWLAGARAWLRSSWRASTSFARTATPRPVASEWLASSVFMRLLFGSAHDRDGEGC